MKHFRIGFGYISISPLDWIRHSLHGISAANILRWISTVDKKVDETSFEFDWRIRRWVKETNPVIGRADNKGKGTETEGFQNKVLEISKPITNLIFISDEKF